VLDHFTQIVLDAVAHLTPNLFLDVGTSFTRALAIQQGGLAPLDPTTIGLPSALAAQIAPQLPQFTIGDMTGILYKSKVGQQHQPRNSFDTHATHVLSVRQEQPEIRCGLARA